MKGGVGSIYPNSGNVRVSRKAFVIWKTAVDWLIGCQAGLIGAGAAEHFVGRGWKSYVRSCWRKAIVTIQTLNIEHATMKGWSNQYILICFEPRYMINVATQGKAVI